MDDMITNRKGNKIKHRHIFKFEDNKYLIVTIDGNNRKQKRRAKKFSKKYYNSSTWFDLYNNGCLKEIN